MIYVHGTPGAAKQWRRYLENPVENTISVAPDRLGFGGSANAPDMRAVVSFEAQAKSLAPLLLDSTYANVARNKGPLVDDAPTARTHNILVGHSLGGPIVAWMAAAHPELVDGIVIVSGSLDPALEKPRWYNRAADLFLIRWLLPRDFVISNDEIMAAPHETKLLGEFLSDVRCPVFILHGAKDSLVPVENVAFMKKTLVHSQQVTVKVLANAGHFIIWTEADEVRDAIQNLVVQISTGADSQ